MSELLDPLGAPATVQASLVGLFVGLLLGFAARTGDFCTLGTLETAMLGRNFRRLHIWGVVLGGAIIGTYLADAAGVIALRNTVHHMVVWNPLVSIIGGLMFGYGMAMAGNCGFGALTRAGGGDIRSLVLVIVLGISSFFALSGPLARLRTTVFPQEFHDAPSGIAHDLSRLTGVPQLALALLIGAGLVIWGLRHPQVRGSWVTLVSAAGVALAVVLSFAGTELVSQRSLDAVAAEGPSFTSSLGRAVLFLMTSTGTGPTFSVGLVFGTFAGAFLASFVRGGFRWEACDDPQELGRQMGGAVLMGFGGVIAIGCTIGQGLTAFATLAWSGPVTLVAIAAGAYIGLLRLVAGGED